MVGEKFVFLLQALGRIPGLQFMDTYANEIQTKALTMRSHKERALELKDRGHDVAKAGKDVTGAGKKGGAKGKSGGGQGSARGGGGGGPGGGGSSQRGNLRSGGNDEWGNTGTDRGGLRRSPPSNTDRLRGPNDPGRGPDRLRRKNYDL